MPAPAAAPSAASPELLQAKWPQVASAVKQSQATAGTFLEEVTRMELDGAMLTLFFDPQNRFGMGIVAKAHEAVSAAIAQTTGHQLRVRCSLDDDGGSGGQSAPQSPAPSSTPSDAPAPAPDPQSPPSRGKGEDLDPTVRAVLDAIDGELV